MSRKCALLDLGCLVLLLSLASASWAASNYFQPMQSYPSGGWRAMSVAVADVNGDGKADLLVANQCATDQNCTLGNGGIGRGAVGVLLGNGDGTFQAAQAYLSGGYAASTIAVADVNNDGKVDLVVAHNCGDINCDGRTVVGVLLGNGDGTFQPSVSYGAGGYGGPYSYYGVVSVAVGDFNRDGKVDIVVANELVQKNEFSKGDALVGILLGNGDGTFQTAKMYNSGDAAYAVSVTVGDVNKDGKLDLVVGHADWNFQRRSTVGVLLGNGDGTFKTAQTYSSHGVVAHSIALEDINGDGKVDILVGNRGRRGNNWSDGVVALLLGNGDGTFAGAQRISSDTAFSIAVSDVNGDGKPDFLVKGRSLRTWLGNGDGTFQLPRKRGTSAALGDSIATADLNGDGRPDVAVAQGCDGENCTPGVGVLLNAVPFASTTGLASNLNPSSHGQAVTLSATVTPSGPYPPTGKVKFLDGTKTIGTAPLSGSVAQLTKSNLAVGTHPITAQYLGDVANDKSISPVLDQIVQ